MSGSISGDALKAAIFFEKQEGRLCAQHALNMLLQGPYFSADVLADIANELDDRERGMLEGEALNRFQSQNLDDTGFFSIQVITVALQRSWDLNLLPLQSPDLAEIASKPEIANAYICNLQEHWFTLRKFHEQWFILNSTQDGPTAITPAYLEIYLKQLETEGYAIFLVDGMLPACTADEIAQEMCALEESMKGGPEPSAPPMNDVIAGDEDADLEMAIAMSLADAAGNSSIPPEFFQGIQPGPSKFEAKIPQQSDQKPSIIQPEASGVTASDPAERVRQQREAFLKRFDKE